MNILKYSFLIFALPLFAQTSDTKYIKVSGGVEKNGIVTEIAVDLHTTKNDFVRLSAIGEFEKYKFQGEKIPVQLGLFNASFYHQLFSLDYEESHNFYVGGGLLGGYEEINNGKKYLSNNAELKIKSKVVYGLNVGAEMHFFLMPIGRHFDGGLFLILEGKYNYLINSDVGERQPTFKVGFRISI